MYKKVVSLLFPISEAIECKDVPFWQDRFRSGRAFEDRFNADPDRHFEALLRLFGQSDPSLTLTSPFHFDLGERIFFGKNVTVDGGVIILDCGKVHIGNNVCIGKNVQIYAVGHTLDPRTRALTTLTLKAVHIGDDVVIGEGAIIYPGVTIGAHAVIEPGARVYRDVRPFAICSGDPMHGALYARMAQDQRFTTVTNNMPPEVLGSVFKKYGTNTFIRSSLIYKAPDTISIGSDVFMNVGATMDGTHGITIQNKVLIGPRVHMFTDMPAVEDILPGMARKGKKNGAITVQENVWVGGGSIIMPGVTIGKNSIIGAGSIVIEDVPENYLVAGSPARALRPLPGTTY